MWLAQMCAVDDMVTFVHLIYGFGPINPLITYSDGFSQVCTCPPYGFLEDMVL